MDSFTINNQNKSQPQHKKSRPPTGAFSQGAVHKSDVGEFQDGYFVMVDAIKENQPLNTRSKNNNYHKNNNTEQRTLERQRSEPLQSRPQTQHQRRERSAPDFTHTISATATSSRQQHGDNHVSPGRITSPSRSPSKNNRRHSPNSQQDNPSPSSPLKNRKNERHVDRTEVLSADSGSPPSKGPSPPSSRWAGPAFSNAPPPSSLPLPEWTLSSQSSSSSPSLPSSQPTQSIPTFPIVYPPAAYYYGQPTMYPIQAHYYYDPSPSQSLDQLSIGLKRMLNINEQVPTMIPA